LLIGALLMSVMLPNFRVLHTHTLRDTADEIVERIDFGRQRAVMTGIPHRLAVNLDTGTYQLEWEGADANDLPKPPTPPTSTDLGAEGSPGQSATTASDTGLEPPLSLAPPPVAERHYEPVPGPLGKLETLGRGVEFAWIETPGGDTDFGDAYIGFEGDGTSTYTVLVLDEPGGRKLSLEILPIAEAVRIFDEES